MTNFPMPPRFPTPLPKAALWPVALLALGAWISIVIALDPGGSYPRLKEGPGLTIDEVFNYEQGVYLLEQARSLGWLNLIPGTSQEAYRRENGYNPDHPPLGRWWLGLHHHLAWWLMPPLDPGGPCSAACARTGSATAFALTVFLIGWCASSWWGQSTGIMGAVSLIAMPRLYGHAHLASLETITNLTCTSAVLVIAHYWTGSEAPRKRVAISSGVIMGLALLTKVQAVLIPVPVIVWAFWRWRTKALLPVTLWSMSALVVFYLSWPYLWLDPGPHLFEYIGRTTNRAPLSVWYFGQKYSDKMVPWHYSFVMFALTIPAIMHIFGLWGVLSSPQCGKLTSQQASGCSRFGRDALLLAAALFPLIVFATPGVAVFDGERLFLPAFPLWAMFVGRGWVASWELLRLICRSWQIATTIWATLVVSSWLPLLSSGPCHLCYYNSIFYLSPGLVDAASLEVDYWGVGITRGLIERLVQKVPEGTRVALIPTLHQFQADELLRQSPILRQHHITLTEDGGGSNDIAFVLIYRRRADLPSSLDEASATIEIVEATGIRDLRLAYLGRRVRDTESLLQGELR